MRFTSTVLALSAAIAAMPALAAEAPANSVRVEYKDLDLTTQAGQETLQNRLDHAARSVCKLDERTTGTRLPSLQARRCYEDARSKLDQHFAALVDRQKDGG